MSGLNDLFEVWRYGVDPEFSIVRPETVTEAAIDCYRNSDAERYVIHYMPPHAPFLHCARKYDSFGETPVVSQNVWDGLRDGGYDLDEVWQDYGQHLINVLDHVEILMQNMSGKIAVSADHGNSLGEFGAYSTSDIVSCLG